jgi:hypothetical protein
MVAYQNYFGHGAAAEEAVCVMTVMGKEVYIACNHENHANKREREHIGVNENHLNYYSK